MTKNDWYEIAALGIGAVALALLFARSGGQPLGTVGAPSATIPAVTPPNYLNYNQSPVGDSYVPLSDIQSLGTAASPSGSKTPSCACGGTSGQILFAGSQGFEDVLNNQLGDIVNTYVNNIDSQVPDFVTQFFNDLDGQNIDHAAQARFSQLS